jgi:hypothetical protein
MRCLVTVQHNIFPRKGDAHNTVRMETGLFSVGSALRLYTEPQAGLVESQPAKRRLGGWCDMAASLGPS